MAAPMAADPLLEPFRLRLCLLKTLSVAVFLGYLT
jgi:hypothetical protein